MKSLKTIIFSLLFVTCVNSAAIKSDLENTEVIPDVTSDLIDASGVTTEGERTKKSPADPKTICFETNVDGKSILQCADDAETSDTIPVPSISSIASGLPALPGHQSLISAFDNSARSNGDKKYHATLFPYKNPEEPPAKNTSHTKQQITVQPTPAYGYTTQSPINPSAKYAESSYYQKPSAASNYSPQYSTSGSSSYSQPQGYSQQSNSFNQAQSSSKPSYAPSYPKSSTSTYDYSSYPQSYQSSGYSQSSGQSSYLQPAGQSGYTSALYSYTEPTHKPTQSYEGYRYYSEAPAQTNSYQYTQIDSSNSALADYEAARATASAKAQAEYEQARAKAEYEKMKAEYDSAQAAESARMHFENARAAENAQAQAAQDQARAEYETSLAEYYRAQAEQQSRAQAEAAARAQAEYEAATISYEQAKAAESARMMYENSMTIENARSMDMSNMEYESARHKAPVYSPPAIHYGAPVEHTYHSAAPSVPCPTNLLFSCAPNVSPVPCQSVAYSHSEPAFKPSVYTRPAPIQINPYTSYRSEPSKQIKRENDSSSTGFKPEVATDITPFEPKPAPSEGNVQVGRQDWS